MPNLGSLWYTLGINTKQLDADLKTAEAKLKNLGVTVDTKNVRKTIEAAIGATPFNATVNFGNARASLDAIFANKRYDVTAEIIASKLHNSIKDALATFSTDATILPKKKALIKAVNDALLASGFEITIGRVRGLTTTINNVLGSDHTLKVSVDPKKLASAIDKAVKSYKGGDQISVEAKDKVLKDSINAALRSERFPIRVIVDKAEAQDAVRQALQAAGLQSRTGFTASDKRAWDAQSRRMEAQAKAAADNALAQRRLASAHNSAASAAGAHTSASINLGGALGSNIKIAGELGSTMASLYSVHAAKQFLSQVIEIGGELEHQKIAMDTIFGDKGKTNELFGQIKGLARQSPFGVMELTKSVKALSAYGVQYNEIYDTAKRLADISAATSVDINRLILAFGKTKSRGFLDGLEAKQFAYANIPIYEMVRKKLEELEGQALTTADVMKRIKKREIGFDIVKDVLWDITDEGGKFHNMQEALAGSVKTSWKLVRDNIELMFGEIAESSVGGALKDVAEILQVLTRNWRAMGAVIASAALTFGVYKVAVAASNAMMGQANALALQKVTAANKVAAANAIEAASYRTLTQDEDYAILVKSGLAKLNRSLLLSHRALTEAEWDAVIASKAVNNDYILRRIALNRLTQAEIDYLISIKAVTAAEVQTAMNARGLKVSIASLWASVKIGAASAWTSMQNFFTRFRIGMTGLGASMKTFKFGSLLTWIKTLPSRLYHAEIGVTRLKLAFSGLGRAMSSIRAFLFNPATMTMAAIGGLMYAWEKNNEQMEKAKEIGGNIFTKASEGADNLKQKLQEIKPSKGLSDLEMERGIEDMIQTIKDYSPTPLKDINDALVAQDGHLLTIEERYEALRKKVEALNASYSNIADNSISKDIENAIKDTKENWLHDDVNANASDLGKALQKREDAIRKFATKYPEYIRKAATDATNASNEFAAATESMNNIQKIEYLIKNLEQFENLRDIPSVSNVLKSKIGAYRLDSGFGIESAMKELESDMQKFADSLSTSAKQKNIDSIKDASEDIKQAYMISIKNQIEGLEVPEEVKTRMYSFYSDLFGLDFETFDIGERLIKIFKEDELAQLGSVIANKLKSGLKLSESEQAEVNNALYKSYLKAFSKANEYEKKALNNALTTNGVFDNSKARRFLINIDATYNWPDWKKELDEQFNGEPQIQTWLKGAADHQSFIKAVQEGVKDAKTTLDKLKPLMLKAGIEFDGNPIHYGAGSLLYGKLNENQKKMIDDYNAVIKAIKAAQAAGKGLGFDPAEEYNKGNKGKKGNQKDEYAEKLKQRFKDIKDAWSEFQKWSKTEGREAAATRIGDSGLFSTLPKDKIPKTIEDYRALVKGLEDELRKAGVKGTAREGLLNDLLKQLLDIDKTVVDEQLKLALDKVSKEAERQLADWDLFDKIRKATGNQDLAMSIAFGMNVNGETDYPTMIKQQLKKTVEAAENALSKAIPKEGESPYEVQGYNYEKLKELYDARETDKGMQAWMAVPEEIRKAWEKANGEILKYFDRQRDSVADIIAKYQSLQDKIAKIDFDRDEEIRKVNESADLTPEKKAQTIQRINVEADYQKFTQSADYLKFFSGIYALTMQQAQEVGDKIRLHLDQRLQAGKISAEEYYKEIERINQQLTKLRNVKSDTMTFMTEGAKGLNQKSLEKADSDVLTQMTKVQEAQEALEEAKASGDEKQIAAARIGLSLAEKELKTRESIRDAIVKDMEAWERVAGAVNIISSIARGISDAFNTLREMADSFGFDTENNAWETVAAAMDTLTSVTDGVQKVIQSLMSGDIGGIISGTFDTLLTPFTIWNKLHDKKLQRDIELSKKRFEQYDRLVTAIERKLSDHFGGYVDFDPMPGTKYGEDGAFGYLRDQKKAQLEELERQQADMEAMKKKDPEAIEDLKAQIGELSDEIANLEIEAANAIYGIDIKGYAETIGNALWDAFMKGEDAAEAFDKAVAEIMSNVVKNILKVNVLERAFQNTKDWLASEDGPMSDGILDETEARELWQRLMTDGKKGMDSWNAAMDSMPEDMKQFLQDNYNKESKSGLSAGIQGVTEDTADLLASYVNAIRASVALNEGRWERLLGESLPQIGVIAQSQLDTQRQIAENTLRNALAAEAIVKSNDDISRLLTRVTQGGAKFYVN